MAVSQLNLKKYSPISFVLGVSGLLDELAAKAALIFPNLSLRRRVSVSVVCPPLGKSLICRTGSKPE